MERIAIIGTGIAGMGAAHFLHEKFDLTIFERNDYVGGHTNTVVVEEEGREVPIDTGFMVYNHATYPNLIRLFKQLSVPERATSMSFSVQYLPSRLEFSGSSLNHLFAQRRNILNPRFLGMLFDINQFNDECLEVLSNPRYASMTLAEYVAAKRFGEDMLHRYLVPMSSAVWSTPPDEMLRFPAATLVQFFHNHGFLGLRTQHQWYTIPGGTRQYREKLIAPFREKIRTNAGVVRVTRHQGGAEVVTADGARASFDKVIFASHADETLSMLADATDMERSLLGEFRYQHNTATLHTDERLMPKKRLAWSSWNYRTGMIDGSLRSSTVYWMNSLQQVSERQNYFLSIDDPGTIRPDRILRTIDYTHPVFSLGSKRAQADLPRLNKNGVTYFCGSYFRYGFHEDGFLSAITMVEELTGEPAWK